MSASKKHNKTEVVMTERQRQEAKEAKNIKRMTFVFVTAIILCVAIFVVSVAAAPVQALVNRSTKALTVGEHTLSAVELNYFYIDAINSYHNTYSSIISYMMDTSKPLNELIADSTTGQTYADYFVDMAVENAKSTYALYDEAMKQGFKLPEDEQAAVDSMISDLDTNIKYYAEIYASMGYSYPYSNASDYLKGMYGNGATKNSYADYYEICYIADAYYAAYADSLEYDDAALREYEKDKLNNYTSFSYNYYLLSASSFYEGGTKGEDGKITYTDEEKQAGIDTAKMLADKIAAGKCEDIEAFDEVINVILNDYNNSKTPAASADDNKDDNKTDSKKASSTKVEETLGSKVNSLFIEWLAEEGRQTGDIAVFENSTGEGDKKVIGGYYVVFFSDRNDNKFQLVNVRHILVAFEGGKYDSTTQTTIYSDEEKAAAKKAAEELLAQWQAGAKTEESFGELANKESDDLGGEVTNGGLYEDIFPGQMVTNFNDWCFEEGRKVGDTGIVETSYGYHVMYFSDFSETNYRDFLITNDARNDEVTAWHEALVKAISATIITDKRVDKDLSMSEVIGH